MHVYINMTTGSQRQHLHQIHVDLRITSPHEGEGDQSPAAQMLSNEAINDVTIFEATKQCRETIGLIFKGNIASCTSASAAWLISAKTPAWAT
jgi:hypothetical protein